MTNLEKPNYTNLISPLLLLLLPSYGVAPVLPSKRKRSTISTETRGPACKNKRKYRKTEGVVAVVEDVGVGGVVVVAAQETLGLDPETTNRVVALAVAWILGDSLRVTSTEESA